jgi:hypothetical protein
MVDFQGESEVGRPPPPPDRPVNRMPEDSPFYEQVVPLLLIAMGVITAALILFAAGVLLGFVPFQ